MAYLALARKWRPKAFSEVVGQQHVVQALSNALDTGRVHHAFLFTGTRGVGKTTLARIFAKSLNCEQGTSAEPCQQCGTCLSVDEGRYVDLIEVDAASRTKVDDTREILENVHYAPTSGKFKVYLIDEVHMLSGHSFNAMLKTLEEPPEHVKFLFATTDPQKLPVTILSRCLQFNLRAMRPEQVENQLVKILGNEGVEYDATALHAIAKAADGSMRDGLSLLDQAIAQGGGEVRTVDVQAMLGTIKAEHTQAIVDALLKNNVDQALSVVADMADNAVDFTVALDEVLIQLYYISLAQVSPNSIANSDIDLNKIKELASIVAPESLQLFYQIGLISKRDIALAPSLRVGFEMALLRMFAFEPAENDPSTVAIPDALSQIVTQTRVEEKSQEATNTETIQALEATEKKTLELVNLTPEYKESSAEMTESVGHGLASGACLSSETQADAESDSNLNRHILTDVSADRPPINASVQSNAPRHSDTEIPSMAEIPLMVEVPPWESSSAELPESVALPHSSTHSTVKEPIDSLMPASTPPLAVLESQTSGPLISQIESSESRALDHEINPNSNALQPLSLISVTLAGNNEWGELVEQTSLVGMAKELAMNCAAQSISDERIDLRLSPKLKHLYEDSRFQDIKIAVIAATHSQITIELGMSESDEETPAECLSRLGYEHEKQVRESMQSDPSVRFLMSEFDAKIKENSIKPLS